MNFFTFLLFIVLLSSQPLLGQRKTKLNTNGQGAIFVQFGYNRSAYTKADVNVQSNAYKYTLFNTALSDNEEDTKLGAYFTSSSPQFSAKLGYFIKHKWAITASFDRYNTFFKDKQEVELEGVFSPNSNSIYSGSVSESILLNRNDFNISQQRGMNIISLGVQRNDMLGRTKKAEFAMHVLYGLKAGIILTNAEYTYDQNTTKDLTSLSGFALTADLGVRMDFFQYIYLQLGINGGLINQSQLMLSTNSSTTAKQVVGFISPNISLGFAIFASTKNNCGTCPQW